LRKSLDPGLWNGASGFESLGLVWVSGFGLGIAGFAGGLHLAAAQV
jgi:hypothetical protein